MNVSKLVDEDEPLFLSLIEDLFVGLKLTTSTYKELQKGIASACSEKGLVNHPPWNLKIIQVYFVCSFLYRLKKKCKLNIHLPFYVAYKCAWLFLGASNCTKNIAAEVKNIFH